MKDYPRVAERIHRMLSEVHPQARTLLDVACGTGELARHLAGRFGYQVDGVDLNPDFIEIASGKHTTGRFVLATMTDFDMFCTYDVVLCLFGSIAQTGSLDAAVSALACFARHVNPGGVMLVEPWLSSDEWHSDGAALWSLDQSDVKISRMSWSARKGRLATVHEHYLVGSREEAAHFERRRQMLLMTPAEMTECFARANLPVEHRTDFNQGDPRGLYIARKALL